MSNPLVSYEPVDYASVAAWAEDDHAAAFAAFLRSAALVIERASAEPPAGGRRPPSPELVEVCRRAVQMAQQEADVGPQAARRFFEESFTPHRLVHSGPAGLVTGYYEPRIAGSRVRSERFAIPIYRRPADLVNLIDEAERGARAGQRTHARRTADGLVPHFTRREIDEGALDGQGLELGYVADPVDLFFMQVQGSGLLEFDDGASIRVTYAGKNGYDYTSIGRYLIESGEFRSENMTLQALIDWLKADLPRAREVMWKNESYVFFSELGPESETSTRGVDGIPLSPARSLAVDTAFHEIGGPVYVIAPDLRHAGPDNATAGFNRLMIAQDVGSAIKGPERGDLFFGTGLEAGSIAGQTMHAAQFISLRPNTFFTAGSQPVPNRRA